MNQHRDHSGQSDSQDSFWKSSRGIALVMLGLVVAFYLIREHWSHLGQRWPYLLLLLCPAIHLFMHRGHGHKKSKRHGNDE